MSQIATKQSFDTNLAQLNLVAPLGGSTQSTQLGSTSLLNFTWSSKSTSCHRRMRITQQRSNGSGLLRIAQIKLVANRIRLAQPTHTTNHRSQVTTTNHKPQTTHPGHTPQTTLTHHTPQTTSSPLPHPPPRPSPARQSTDGVESRRGGVSGSGTAQGSETDMRLCVCQRLAKRSPTTEK